MALLCACIGFVSGLAMGVALGAYRLARAQRDFASAWQARAEESDRMRLRVTHFGDQVDGLFDERSR